MRFIRDRAAVIAAIALLWQVSAVAAVSTALSCGETTKAQHADAPSHEGMADCPMEKSEPSCPRHPDRHGTPECDCPTVGCAQTDAGFLALFGAVGVLTAAGKLDISLRASVPATLTSATPIRLAAVPLAPPPRLTSSF